MSVMSPLLTSPRLHPFSSVPLTHAHAHSYHAIAGVMRLRESIRPYVQAHLDLATSEGTPLLRPMVFDFSDEECIRAVDQYMFGPDWLVAPVLEYNATNRTVYLPRLPGNDTHKQRWVYHYDGNAPLQQPGWIVMDTRNISRFPLFRREAVSLSSE